MDNLETLEVQPSIGQIDYLRSLHTSGAGETPLVLLEITIEDLDFDLFESTIFYLIKRHESLRTTFPMIRNAIKMRISPFEKNKYKIHHERDVPSNNIANRKELILKAIKDDLKDIEEGPLIRTVVLHQSDNTYYILIAIHHLLCDAYSSVLIEKEIRLIYSNFKKSEPASLPKLNFQLRDYCKEVNLKTISEKEKRSSFWKEQLNGFDGMVDIKPYYDKYYSKKINHFNFLMPGSGQLRKILEDGKASMFSSVLEDDSFQKLIGFAALMSRSTSSIIYASLSLFIRIYAKKERVLIAALVAERDSTEKEMIVGNLVGGIYVPVLFDFEKTISDFIDDIFYKLFYNSQQVIHNHQFLGLDGHQYWLRTDIYINYIKTAKETPSTESIKKYHTKDDNIFYALNTMVLEYKNALCINWRYNSELFTSELIEDMALFHKNLLSFMIDNPKATITDAANILS